MRIKIPSQPVGESGDSIEVQIGRRIRALRTERDISLAQLAAESRLTKGQFSKIENGRVSCPISTLMRISAALGVPVGSFFDSSGTADRVLHVKRGERKPIVRRGSKIGHTYESLAFDLPFEKDFESYVMTIEEKKIRPAQNVFKHAGNELLFLLEGKMVYRHGEQTFAMEPGDSLFFDASIEHGPVSVKNTPVRFLTIISNPK